MLDLIKYIVGTFAENPDSAEYKVEENGNIVNSVNYPTCAMPRTTAYRLVILHKNTQNILAQITGTVGNEGINISNLTNQSKGDYAVTILDIDNEVSDDAIKHIADVENIIRVRVIK